MRALSAPRSVECLLSRALDPAGVKCPLLRQVEERAGSRRPLKMKTAGGGSELCGRGADGDFEAQRLDALLQPLRLHRRVVPQEEVVGARVFVERSCRQKMPGDVENGV